MINMLNRGEFLKNGVAGLAVALHGFGCGTVRAAQRNTEVTKPVSNSNLDDVVKFYWTQRGKIVDESMEDIPENSFVWRAKVEVEGGWGFNIPVSLYSVGGEAAANDQRYNLGDIIYLTRFGLYYPNAPHASQLQGFEIISEGQARSDEIRGLKNYKRFK